MSYYLLFNRPNTNQLSAAEFAECFANRPNYTLNANQAVYENEDTGVYFIFELNSEEPEKEEDEADPPHVALFILNLVRPHVFALEAEPEIRRFINHFQMEVINPQDDTPWKEGYTSGRFIDDWNKHNRSAVECILAEDSLTADYALPARSLEACWRWNHLCNTLQEQLGDNIFVPSIKFLSLGGRIVTAAVWPDAIPITMPTVDCIVVLRKKLAPRRLFGRKEDTAVVTHAQASAILSHFPLQGEQMKYRLLQYDYAPDAVTAFVRHLPAFKGKLEGIALDSILDEELMQLP